MLRSAKEQMRLSRVSLACLALVQAGPLGTVRFLRRRVAAAGRAEGPSPGEGECGRAVEHVCFAAEGRSVLG